MAQAAIELPDPLDTPQESLANPDDLLSQLAGSEIDRLLAEADGGSDRALPADVGRDSSIESVPTADNAIEQTETELADVSAQLKNLFDELKSEDASGGPRKSEKSTPELSKSELDHVVDAELREKQQAAPASMEREALFEAAGFESEKTADEARPNENIALDPTSREATEPHGHERDALLTAAGFETGLTDDGESEEEDISQNEDGHGWVAPLPIYLKPLVWLNAPFDACPPGLRQAMGKLAIVTTLNAAAVIAYVIFFRKH